MIKEMSLTNNISASIDTDTIIITDTTSGNAVILTTDNIKTIYHYCNGLEKHKQAVLRIISDFTTKYPDAKDMFTTEQIDKYIAFGSSSYDEVIGYDILIERISQDITQKKGA